ncbi:hypothetical protein C672_3036 [[Clostridium] bifermentans ATCC 638]|uniref:Uncharacterized protein n=1 Tax=Paraclostridium bifermentans ATCC 638 = DSM 14991 TaxID=1233171 RepID=T4VJJ9_PARBF|nr:hypothetical protein [Paraclostridium bifermentans]EQK41295.1 hypothetical protein C672_3036 [[Clostridium] bifermentans ATCC 638] [Paraclostridium bifermentans ATCC 638 = DSM 14991]RIZ58982.1 hypothetical protein CHH45_08125 [Paraclostridium bifermentans]UAG18498.1 hypothetical protein KXZ80_01935 [Paraclostridium bifermentans]
MFKVTVSICSNQRGLRNLQEFENYLRKKYNIINICITYPCRKKGYRNIDNSIQNATYGASDYIQPTGEPVNLVYTVNFLL